MTRKTYIPRPIDTGSVCVPEELRALGEMLARNTHDLWAQQRMAQGWTYGETRDEERKLHPDLVPYEDLPESEKEYDRNTSMETIRVILSLGYRIEKAETPGTEADRSQGEKV